MENHKETGPAAPQPPTVEDLIKVRQDLEQGIAAAKKQKEDDIAKKLTEREVLVAEDRQLVPLLEEAEKTLAYFETQNEQGSITSEKDITEFEKLKTLVSSLRLQRNDTFAKYDEITNTPEVYEKVLEEADKMNMEKEFKDRYEEATKEISKQVEKTSDAIEQLSSHIDLAAEKVVSTKNALNWAMGSMLETVLEACKKLNLEKSKQNVTAGILKDFNNFDNYAAYITAIEKYREKLGWGRKNEKAAIDFILQKKLFFNETDAKAAAASEASEDLKTEDTYFIDVLAEQHKALLLEAWEKQRKMEKDFPEKGFSPSQELPGMIHYGILDNLEKKSGFGKMVDGKWVKPALDDKRERGFKQKEEEKLQKFKSLFKEIEEKAGEYLYMFDPERPR